MMKTLFSKQFVRISQWMWNGCLKKNCGKIPTYSKPVHAKLELVVRLALNLVKNIFEALLTTLEVGSLWRHQTTKSS